MADIVDTAQDRIGAEMAARLRLLPRFDIASKHNCIDCEEEIPRQRRAIGGVTRCIDCQNEAEGRG